MFTKMAEHGKPVRPLGAGRAHLPYDHCDAFHIKQPVRRVHTMVVIKVPHKPSECPIMLGRTGSKLPVEGLCNWLQAGLGGGTQPLAAQLAQEGPVPCGVDGGVERLQKGPPLVLSFLANKLRDVPVQQLDGRVEGVISAALISLHDEKSHNIREGPQ